jgi:hypothetical protein
MQSHRRPRGKIAFESFCAVCVGASFVGAWIQTGAWAFLAPAFVFTLFGLYWSFDMFGSREAVQAPVERAPAPIVVAEPELFTAAEPASRGIEIVAIEEFVADIEPAAPAEPMAPEPAAAFVAEPESVVPAKPKRRAKKAEKVVERMIEPVVAPAPVAEAEPVTDEPFFEDHPEPHIEQLFDPQPFVRQARPAFGKRPRGPGPRPLPA